MTTTTAPTSDNERQWATTSNSTFDFWWFGF